MEEPIEKKDEKEKEENKEVKEIKKNIEELEKRIADSCQEENFELAGKEETDREGRETDRERWRDRDQRGR